MAKLNADARKQIRAAVEKSQSRRERAGFEGGGGVQVAESGNGPFIVITTEAISPNTFGGFKFVTGARGSETATGNEYQAFWFAESDADDLTLGTKCFAVWIPSSEPGESGWVITPILCP